MPDMAPRHSSVVLISDCIDASEFQHSECLETWRDLAAGHLGSPVLGLLGLTITNINEI